MATTQTTPQAQPSAFSKQTAFLNFIGGDWVPAKSGKTFESRNPADPADLIGVFPSSGKEDVDMAVAAAKKAYEKWRLVPAPKRGEILFSNSGIGEKNSPKPNSLINQKYQRFKTGKERREF